MQKKTGVILLNLGGPEKLEDVGPFLNNLFSDREIIRLGPVWLQKPLAWIIARTRAPKSRATYARIGGGSPLIRITRQQALALQEILRSEGDFRVVTAMRYWQPRAAIALEELAGAGISDIIVLPLYPHYSCATTGSSLTDLKAAVAAASNTRFHLREIASWPDHPSYISCLSEHIRKGLAGFSGEQVQIVYSAHSLPAAFIDQGDPYLEHLQKTQHAIETETGSRGLLCFQSRSGPVRWLSPSTPETIWRLAQSGCKNILMVPISFVSDHVETLYEIDILYKQMARDLGMRLESSASLNTDPAFINCLKDIVLEKFEETRNSVI
jgi:protoporphyrin/coproporphyrin ferrochelatase